jgi:hypothetical protein
MKYLIFSLLVFAIAITFQGCRKSEKVSSNNSVNILFLHHSVGLCVWEGKQNFLGKHIKAFRKSAVKNAFDDYNKSTGKSYLIDEQIFPKETPYGWNNFPYDYYNIWIKHAGDKPFMEEPTLEMLSKQYQVIIWKHCFPVSDVVEDTGKPDIDSPVKKIENYKLQYLALRDKMHQFPNVKFIVWTGAAQVKSATNNEDAKRALEFFNWVKNEWDLPNDNIYLWDFRELETEGGLFLLDKNAANVNNSHPNAKFSGQAAGLIASRIIDVIENNGTKTTLTGVKK